MLSLKLVWMLLLQVVIIRGFSPYFYLGPSTLNYYDSIDYCLSIGMKLVKINNDQMNNMAAQFIMNAGIFDDVWMSVYCQNQLCHWNDGETLDYASWATPEPQFECGKFSKDYAYVLWKTGYYTELNRPLCYAPPHPNIEFIHGDFNFYEASRECYNLGGQLAVLSNPVAITILKELITYEPLTGDVWIGLYGNGAHLTWQNMFENVVYTDWKPGHTVPNSDANVSIAVDKIDGTWVSKTKSTRLPHALCQYNYNPMSYSVDYQTAQQDCEKYALELAMLHTSEEFTVAKNAIVYQGMDINNDFWIGLTSTDGITFQWNDGTDLTETAWIPGSPSSLALNQHVKLIYTVGFDWDNRIATETSPFLCQYPTANYHPISQDIVEDFTTEVSTPTGISGQWHVGGTNNSRYFHVDKTDSIPTALPYLTENSKTKIYCAYLCLHRGTICTAFVYKTEQCLLFNEYSCLNTTPDNGSDIWV